MLLSEGMDYRMYGIHVLLGTGTLEGKRKKGLIGGSIVLLYNTDIRGGRSQVLAAGLEARCLGRKKKKRTNSRHFGSCNLEKFSVACGRMT